MRAKQKNDELPAATSAAQRETFSDSVPPINEPRGMIERRAYELYQQRAGQDGDALSDWLRAEAEIRAAPGSDEQKPVEKRKTTRSACKGTNNRQSSGQ